jgi:hypothetical protein
MPAPTREGPVEWSTTINLHSDECRLASMARNAKTLVEGPAALPLPLIYLIGY